jgi:hypothetical protein
VRNRHKAGATKLIVLFFKLVNVTTTATLSYYHTERLEIIQKVDTTTNKENEDRVYYRTLQIDCFDIRASHCFFNAAIALPSGSTEM